jgi:hypothetical protein
MAIHVGKKGSFVVTLAWESKRGECPDERTTTSDKPNKRKAEKQIILGHAGFWPKQVRAPAQML